MSAKKLASCVGKPPTLTNLDIPHYLLSNQLDYDIWNGKNDQIGEVENMVIDLAKSRVTYVYIETGGFLDIGDTESLVPWGALRLALNEDPDVVSDDNVFILEVDQGLLEDSPDFDDGERLVPVPLNQHHWNDETETFVVSADQTTLEDAPVFEDETYPDTFVDGWETEYFDYWH